MEKGVELEILHLRRWKPKISKDKNFLISILRRKNRVGALKNCNLDVLIRLTGAAQDFQKAATTAYLRRIIGRTIKSCFGWSLNSKVTVKLKFDDRIRIAEVRKFLNDKLEESVIPACLKNHARRGWANWRGPRPMVSRGDAEACLTGEPDAKTRFLDLREVHRLKARLDGLVLTPLDRNPGDTLVLCPKVYYEAMLELFVASTGYVVTGIQEAKVMEEMRSDVEKAGLTNLVQWDKKGKIGEAYVMPKHKDLTRFRPICPTYSEPTIKGCRLVVKALNHMLYTLPRDWHFNLKSVSSLVLTLDRINKMVGRRMGISSVLSAMSYDIKDMFSKLPHDEIEEAVDWLVDYHLGKGRRQVRVSAWGKGCTFGRTAGDYHWRSVDLQQIKCFVRMELRHAYTQATGVLLRQVIEIPMGKSTSPPLACILCAFAEFKFLRNLGRASRDVFGVRLMDDVSLVVLERRHSSMTAEEIQSQFESCYPKNLLLKRTNDGSGSRDFWGTQMSVNQIQPFVTSYQTAKNERTIWGVGTQLELKNGQSYRSWGSKQQKSACDC
ncbi:hypothetical protein CBR_g38979 [Chara braunii]|uniref:Reverse transcriptase domain-containing protein n=1 Tax=Chara braunii TaxID=69332 RepID=A0A388K0W4_CHABU|nr:hypothetical protein CBR_g38979 [Chara braunii]|eukprot:GBG63667.1 hypothetical protein CBR_g38979 [Chara braunii]